MNIQELRQKITSLEAKIEERTRYKADLMQRLAQKMKILEQRLEQIEAEIEKGEELLALPEGEFSQGVLSDKRVLPTSSTTGGAAHSERLESVNSEAEVIEAVTPVIVETVKSSEGIDIESQEVSSDFKKKQFKTIFGVSLPKEIELNFYQNQMEERMENWSATNKEKLLNDYKQYISAQVRKRITESLKKVEIKV